MAVAIGLEAQEKGTIYSSDTLNYQQLMEDYVSLNNQIMQFRKCELRSIGLGFGAGVFAFAGTTVYNHNKGAATASWVVAGGLGVVSLVNYIFGYTKLKRNQLEVTPQGVIVKLTPQKSHRKTKN